MENSSSQSDGGDSGQTEEYEIRGSCEDGEDADTLLGESSTEAETEYEDAQSQSSVQSSLSVCISCDNVKADDIVSY